MGGPGGPGAGGPGNMNGPGMGGGMNGPGGPSGMGPGAGGPGMGGMSGPGGPGMGGPGGPMNGPAGQRPMVRARPMGMQMQMGNVAMGVRPGGEFSTTCGSSSATRRTLNLYSSLPCLSMKMAVNLYLSSALINLLFSYVSRFRPSQVLTTFGSYSRYATTNAHVDSKRNGS